MGVSFVGCICCGQARSNAETASKARKRPQTLRQKPRLTVEFFAIRRPSTVAGYSRDYLRATCCVVNDKKGSHPASCLPEMTPSPCFNKLPLKGCRCLAALNGASQRTITLRGSDRTP